MQHEIIMLALWTRVSKSCQICVIELNDIVDNVLMPRGTLTFSCASMTTWQILENLIEACPRALLMQHIFFDFKISGIYPFNRLIFDEDYFLSNFCCFVLFHFIKGRTYRVRRNNFNQKCCTSCISFTEF